MAAFVVAGPGWYVEDIGDERYPVYAVWDWAGKVFYGVASEDGLEDLLEAKALAAAKATAPLPGGTLQFRFRCIRVPGRASANAHVEVQVDEDGKGGWKVAGIRDIRPRKVPRKSG